MGNAVQRSLLRAMSGARRSAGGESLRTGSITLRIAERIPRSALLLYWAGVSQSGWRPEPSGGCV